MRVDRQRRNNFTYHQTVYIILTFYILRKGKCNSTDTNNSTSTSPHSTTSNTTVYSTLNTSNFSTSSKTSYTFTSSSVLTSNTYTSIVSPVTTLNTSINITHHTSATTAAFSSTNTRFTTLLNNATNITSLVNTTATIDVTSNENSLNASTMDNTTSNPRTSFAVNYTITINGTNSSSFNICEQNITIRVKATEITAEEGNNVTIRANSTWSCPLVTWIRHYNLTTHGHHIYPYVHRQTNHRHKILTSHIICHPDRSPATPYHDLCRSCNKTELHLYDLNTTNSGRYSRRCYKDYNGPYEDENFRLIVKPRNGTDNYTIPVCPKSSNSENDDEYDYTASTIRNANHRHKTNYRDSSHITRTTWTVTLICIACVLLFFARRAFNKKYHQLQDDISESHFIVYYNPEHED
ncbi:membrane protein RL12 [Human betaherpesvirus 5]|nr:membrane protein RL12 [Human betaherpesvirus 5]AQN69624.1 membrane protein RL12 [Human betaherpesvirus 5]AQN69792.1 membrane protein RL12 [Human betaherpesvirus 5]